MDGKYIKSKFKPFLIGIGITLIAQGAIYGFYIYNKSSYKDRDSIRGEVEKCNNILNEENPEITDYSYCKKYLEWVKNNVPEN